MQVLAKAIKAAALKKEGDMLMEARVIRKQS